MGSQRLLPIFQSKAWETRLWAMGFPSAAPERILGEAAAAGGDLRKLEMLRILDTYQRKLYAAGKASQRGAMVWSQRL